MAKSTTEKIQSKQEEIKQHENELKRLIQKQREEERRERNKRLIHWGIAVESVLKKAELLTEPFMPEEEVKAIFAEGISRKRPQMNGKAAFSPVKQAKDETFRKTETANIEGEKANEGAEQP